MPFSARPALRFPLLFTGISSVPRRPISSTDVSLAGASAPRITDNSDANTTAPTKTTKTRRAAKAAKKPIPPESTSAPAQFATLLAEDGTALRAVHDPAADGSLELAVVIAHGFTGAWQRPAVRRIVDGLTPHVGVVTVDLRGHGDSAGHSTLGDLEVLDVDTAIGWARLLGYRQVATLGFSLGAMVVLRHAGLSIDTPAAPDAGAEAGAAMWTGSPGDCSSLSYPPDAVVAVSSPGRWDFPHSRSVRIARIAIENPLARRFARYVLNTRVSHQGWAVLPAAPDVAVARTGGVPLLVIQGDADPYFTIDHGQGLFDAAADPKELWIVPGFGHAENAVGPELLVRIAEWMVGVREGAHPGAGAVPIA